MAAEIIETSRPRGAYRNRKIWLADWGEYSEARDIGLTDVIGVSIRTRPLVTEVVVYPHFEITSISLQLGHIRVVPFEYGERRGELGPILVGLKGGDVVSVRTPENWRFSVRHNP